MLGRASRTAADIRRFNRFYLPYFRLLTQKYLNSEYSAAEARILYEIYENRRISARDIVVGLHIDKGYLSRVLKKFASKGLLNKEPSPEDSRLTLLSLTEQGEALAERLIMESNAQVAGYIQGLSEEELAKLSYHLGQITELLGGRTT